MTEESESLSIARLIIGILAVLLATVLAFMVGRCSRSEDAEMQVDNERYQMHQEAVELGYGRWTKNADSNWNAPSGFEWKRVDLPKQEP